MIVSFAHKGLENFFTTGSTKGIQAKHKTKLAIQLSTLNRAKSPNDMDAPSWRLHPLKGNLAGHWSVMVNGNWRLTFRFNDDGNAEIVDYQDYH
ncbi:type II toxin-antitoxin system RelE/ParE family toxin [Moraxella nasovis]|uniref:type II toxin-antitoxin system RelE/ParE family toxin n=1 Tax=Moraxella nasovis TaxID=2904121 RepID=UPI001F609733|nr:type II toxin-antitoxin system RelE/ParE family toxin [Moraxella nasovis]UNU73289.1 type II toxin-antitoxin system RelE/ParE family toxin [Moraxella nasovis]